jgi:hypothetical protein
MDPSSKGQEISISVVHHSKAIYMDTAIYLETVVDAQVHSMGSDRTLDRHAVV